MKNPNILPGNDDNQSKGREGYNFLRVRRDLVDYQAEAPTTDADWLMSAVIDRSNSTIARKRFSQTPLAPNLLVDMVESYPTAAGTVLEARIYEIADQIDLREPYLSIVMHEVISEHQRRIIGNMEAANRLTQAIAGTQLPEHDAELIWKARTGDASISETGELLLRYPIMRSIEAGKHTQPFSINAKLEMMEHMRKGLFGLARLASSEQGAYLDWYQTYEDDSRDLRSFEISKNEEDSKVRERQRKHIKGIKENLAEFSDGKTTIQLISKEPVIRIPEEVELLEVPDNLVHLEDGYFHSHFLSMSCYWSVKTR
ncbi:MAG: hypothetical protein JWN75_121 [Candidatus Saccharibacteria bacterium]|nr:hypothetical protein [Candidatus Saccharibacteria bacterium]